MIAPTADEADPVVIHEDAHAYSAHPHLAVAANGDWLLAFTQTRRRAGVLHPPQDPLYCTMLMRSSDEGRSWSVPSPVPGYGWQGVECAGLTVLRSGAVLLNQWKFGWYTLAHAVAHLPAVSFRTPHELMGPQAMAAELSDWSSEAETLDERYPWARSGGETWLHRSHDHGATFARSVRIDTAPFSGGYGMRGAVEVDGVIVLPLSDVPHYAQVFVVRSDDDGQTWSAPILVAAGDGHEFEEPAPLVLPDGAILMLLRDNVSRDLHAVRSSDGGLTWSKPAATGIADYPAHLVGLADGRIAAVTGRRRAPFGIALYLSEDAGASWNAATPFAVRSDLPNRDLGYPTAALRADGSLFVAYYAQSASGITGLQATVVSSSALATAGRIH